MKRPPFRIYVIGVDPILMTQLAIALRIEGVKRAETIDEADFVISDDHEALRKTGKKDCAWLDDGFTVPARIGTNIDRSDSHSLTQIVETLLLEQKLPFGYLEGGQKFIAFPSPGDNEGHGGYLKAHSIFTKLKVPTHQGNCMRMCDGGFSSMPDSMPVIHIE